MARPPSAKQLGYLKGLGYRLTSPETSAEASFLIDAIKGGDLPTFAEAELLGRRRAKYEAALSWKREYLSNVREMNRDAEEWEIVGFKIVVDREDPDPGDAIYDGAFLPLELAEKHPELLLVGLGNDEVRRSDRKPLKIVVAPGHVVDRQPGQHVIKRRSKSAPEKSSGCENQLLLLSFLIIAIAAILVG